MGLFLIQIVSLIECIITPAWLRWSRRHKPQQSRMGRKALLVKRTHLETTIFNYSCFIRKLWVLFYLNRAWFNSHPKLIADPKLTVDEMPRREGECAAGNTKVPISRAASISSSMFTQPVKAEHLSTVLATSTLGKKWLLYDHMN